MGRGAVRDVGVIQVHFARRVDQAAHRVDRAADPRAGDVSADRKHFALPRRGDCEVVSVFLEPRVVVPRTLVGPHTDVIARAVIEAVY